MKQRRRSDAPDPAPAPTPVRREPPTTRTTSEPKAPSVSSTAGYLERLVAQEDARAVFNAVDGWGTDERGLFSALRGGTPPEQLAQVYEEDFGEPLLAALQRDLSGEQLAEAEALLAGDTTSATLLGLDNALGVNDDEAGIESLMRSLNPEARESLLADPRWEDVQTRVRKNLGGADLDVFDALVRSDMAEASAVRLDAAMGTSRSWFDPRHLGTNESRIEGIIGGASEDERNAIAEAFEVRTNVPLNTALGSELSGADALLVDGLMHDDPARVHAARLASAMKGLGTRRSSVFEGLEGLDTEELNAAREAYHQAFDEPLDARVASEMSGADLERAQHALSGTTTDASVLFHAIQGLGTREDDIRGVLEGKTAAEIEALRQEWDRDFAPRLGRSLDEALQADLSGQDAFDLAEIGMRGVPQSPEEMREVGGLRYDYERGDRSTWFGRSMMDIAGGVGLSRTAEVLDHQHQRLHEAEDDQVGARYLALDGTIEDYRSDRAAVGEAVVVTGEIAAATITTVLTEGAASPWLVAAIGSATGIATRSAIHGEAYGRESIGLDALKGAIAAGIVKGASAGALQERLSEVSRVFGPEFVATMTQPGTRASTMLHSGAMQGLEGAAEGMLGGAFDDEAHEQGAMATLGAMADGGWRGAVRGAAIGAVSGSLGPVRKAPEPEPFMDPEVVRADLQPAVREMFEAGPNRWVPTGFDPEGAHVFQRGLSGDYTQPGGGLSQSMEWLSGKQTDDRQFASLLGSMDDSDRFMREVTDQYASPLAIRGRATLGDLGDGRTGSLPAGSSIDQVSDMVLQVNRLQPESWALRVHEMHERLAKAGMTLDPSSRGAGFIAEVQQVLDSRVFSTNSFGDQMIDNYDEYRKSMRAVVDAYRE